MTIAVMDNPVRRFIGALLAILLLRMLLAAVLPMMDTTEPRYAEISRLMVERQDWVTPWFDEQTPFWGKPPLSIWGQALAIQWFGPNDLAPRLPSWLLAFVLAWMTAHLATRRYGRPAGLWAALALVSMALPFASAGAVMTDMFLVLGVMMSLSSFAMVLMGEASFWRWIFFIGLAVSMLAKGPVGVVLTGIPMGGWFLFAGGWRRVWAVLPWVRGTLLTLLLVTPWYLAAETRTPGFLDYFFIGEHVRRFTEPGWAGDLYGRAHEEPRGMIWLYWLAASFPWGLLLLWRAGQWIALSRAKVLRADPVMLLLVGWMLAPMLLFTLAGNILWTYVLPGLPAVAVLLAPALQDLNARLRQGLLWLVPMLALAGGVFVLNNPDAWRSERANLAAVEKDGGELSSMVYLREVPFSARYYARGELVVLRDDPAREWWSNCQNACYLAVPRRMRHGWLEQTDATTQVLSRSRDYTILVRRQADIGERSNK